MMYIVIDKFFYILIENKCNKCKYIQRNNIRCMCEKENKIDVSLF